MMTLHRLLTSLPCAFLLFVLFCAPAHCEDPGPKAIVQGVYAPFLDPDGFPAPDLQLLKSIASPGLAALIDRKIACLEDEDNPCFYDFSVIVNGQDYLLTDFTLAEQEADGGMVMVVASFNNFDMPMTLHWLFEKHQGQWLLTDIRSEGEYPWSLADDVLRQ